MPTIALSRYAPYSPYPYGTQPISPGLLSPEVGEDTSPAFDPQMAQVDQNQTQNPLPPPPSVQPPPQSLNDTQASSQIANPLPLVPLNGTFPAGGSAKDTGAKQLLAKAQMLPPTPPPSMQPQAAPAPPQGSFPAGGFGAPSLAQPVPDVGGGAAPNAAPPTKLDPAIVKQEERRKEEEEKWKGNEAPKSNWLQRLSTALLALTKFAPYSNQIVHPKWSEQAAQHQAVLRDIGQQEKAIEQANTSQAAVDYKEAVADQRSAQGQNYANAEADRQSLNKQKEQDAQRKAWDDQLKIMTHGREGDTAYLDQSDPNIQKLKDSGYSVISDKFNPGRVVAIPPPLVQIKTGMEKYMPGHEPGDLVPWSEYKEATINAAKQQQELAKPVAPVKPPATTNEYEGLVQQHTDPATGVVDWKAVNDENDKRQIQRAQASKTQVTVGTPLTQTQIDSAAKPVSQGQKREEFLSSLPADQQRVIKALTDYTYPKLSSQSLRPAANGQKGYYQDLLDKAFAYDPSFDYKQYDSRQKLLNDFTSGKSAQNIRSLNTLTGHLGTLDQMGAALQNKDQNTYNKLANSIVSEFGDPRLTDFNLAKAAVSTELSNALKGQATEGDIKNWADNIRSSGSPQQLRDTVRVPLGLMHTRMQELQNQYTQGMGKPFKWPSEQAMDAFRKAGLDPLSVDPLGYVRTGTMNGRRIGAKADGTIWDLATGQQVKQ
jgi:hypothetical protein